MSFKNECRNTDPKRCHGCEALDCRSNPDFKGEQNRTEIWKEGVRETGLHAAKMLPEENAGAIVPVLLAEIRRWAAISHRQFGFISEREVEIRRLEEALDQIMCEEPFGSAAYRIAEEARK